MDWAAEQGTWPLAEHSRFVESRPHRWHVQDLGDGPVLLMLPGTGGATQSFRHLAPALAERFRVVAVDYPGQGFTRPGTRLRCGLGHLAEDIAALLDHMEIAPDLILGHSAGAAVALQLLRTGAKAPVVGINPALLPFEGSAGWLFPAVAKLLSLNPFVAGSFALASRLPGRVDFLLAATGSTLDPAGTALYRRLLGDPTHVDWTLEMMAQWSLKGLEAALPDITAPALFLVGETDRAVPPESTRQAAVRMDNASVVEVPGAGHLLHETHGPFVAGAVMEFSAGLLAA
ncbi:MAG: alpha/beta fold hydrolase BchO [Pseudomonadota bacterium]